MTAQTPTFESGSNQGRREASRWLDEWFHIGDGREPDDLVVEVNTDGDDWQYPMRFTDALGYAGRPEQLLAICDEPADWYGLCEGVAEAVSRWEAQYDEATLERFYALQRERVQRTADLVDQRLRDGDRCMELDILTQWELESRGWVDVEDFEPVAPEEGHEGL